MDSAHGKGSYFLAYLSVFVPPKPVHVHHMSELCCVVCVRLKTAVSEEEFITTQWNNELSGHLK